VGSPGTHGHDAQEKPDFPRHPAGAAEGADTPELSLKLPAEMTFCTCSLWHLLH
jgi:hypothetical protein